MGASRNGSAAKPSAPQEGERGVTGANSHLGESLFRYGKRRPPTVPELHRMLMFDPWAEAIEGALTWPIRSAKWSIAPAEGDAGEAEEARRQFARIANRAIAGALSAVGRRVAYAEQVWGRGSEATGDRQTLVLEDLAFRSVDQCAPVPDRSGRPTGFRQRAYAPGRGVIDETFLAEEGKAFVFLHNAPGRPGLGRSALESAYQHYEDKQKLRFYRYKSLEKYGGPSTYGKTDAPEGSNERRSFEKAVRDLRSGGSATFGTDAELGYLMPPNSGDAFQRAEHDLNFEMAVASFVQWLALAQEGNSGAYELSRDHSDFLTIVTEGRMSELADALTSGPIHDITFYNRGPGAAFPVFEFEPISENTQKLILQSADMFFRKNGMVPPNWLAEGVAEGHGKALGIEKPEGAEKTDPVREPARGTSGTSGAQPGDENGSEAE